MLPPEIKPLVVGWARAFVRHALGEIRAALDYYGMKTENIDMRFRVVLSSMQHFEEERWLRAEEHLHAALAGKLDLAAALKDKMSRQRIKKRPTATRPHRIKVDNKSSSFFTLVEVFTYDFTGLLYSITDALFRCQLDVWIAKIATKVDQVVDVFYVRDFAGPGVFKILFCKFKIFPGQPSHGQQA